MNERYKPPQADLEAPLPTRPKQIDRVIILLIVSWVLSLINIFIGSTTEYGLSLFDISNIVIMLVWTGVIIWFISDLIQANYNPKNTLFFLTAIVLVISFLDADNLGLLITGLAEACCFLISGLMLRSESLKTWFRK